MAEGNQTLLRRVMAAHFNDFLNRHGFSETSYKYDPVNFGNEFLGLHSADFCLLFVNARGCLEIRIRPVADSEWIDISIFLEFLGHPLDLSNVENYQGIVGAENLAPVYARALEEHFDTILDLLQPRSFEKTQIQFDAFLEERGPRMFPGLYGVKA